MAKDNYWISPKGSKFVAQKENSNRVSGIFSTQKKAENFARTILQNNNGGELITQNRHGQIRSKDTINRTDPNPPRDTEH
jgi:hypothetical protein